MSRAMYWFGRAPTQCDVTKEPIVDEFIDGRTIYGTWANMTPKAHAQHGLGLGTGLGQRYRKQADGKWLKVEG